MFREIEIEGQKFQVKAWTVRDRKEYLKEITRIGEVKDQQKQYQEVVKFVASQAAKTEEEVEAMDAVVFDRLFDAILRSNTPL